MTARAIWKPCFVCAEKVQVPDVATEEEGAALVPVCGECRRKAYLGLRRSVPRGECARKPPCGRCPACRQRRQRDLVTMHLLGQRLKSGSGRTIKDEPACTCALDDDAPYGGHKVHCPKGPR